MPLLVPYVFMSLKVRSTLKRPNSLKIHIRVRLSIAFSFTVFKRKILENVEHEHECFTSGIFELNFEKVHMIVTLHLDKKEYKKCT